VRDLLPNLPRRLDTLIVHMLARSPGDRLASAAEARDALDPGLALAGWDPKMITAQRVTPNMSMQAARNPRMTSDPSLRPTIPMPRQFIRRERLLSTTVVAAACLVGGVFFWTLRRATPPPIVAPKFDSAAAALGTMAPPTPVTTKTGQKPTAPVNRGAGRPSGKGASPIAIAVPPIVTTPDTSAPRKDSTLSRRDSAEAATLAPINELAEKLQVGDSISVSRQPANTQLTLRDIYKTDKPGLRVFVRNAVVSRPSSAKAQVQFKLEFVYYGPNHEPLHVPIQEVADLERQNGEWIIKSIKPGTPK
jgi:hypothetical protein